MPRVLVTYADKVGIANPPFPAINKVQAADMNEIKNVINDNEYSGRFVAAGIIEPDGLGNYQLLTTGGHNQINWGVPTVGSNFISIPYTPTLAGMEVLFFTVTPDETFKAIGVGARFTSLPGELLVFPSINGPRTFQFRGRYNSGPNNWTALAGWTNGISIGATNTGTDLRLTHDASGLTLPHCNMIFANWGVRFRTLNDTSTDVIFFDPATGLTAAPPNLTEVVVTRISRIEPMQANLDPADPFLQQTIGNFEIYAFVQPV